MRYIGSKINLIDEISVFINDNIKDSNETFLDLFGGTNCIGRFFKSKYTIYSNDALYFSYINSKAIIENDNSMSFNKLINIGIMNPIDYLQSNADMCIEDKAVGYYEKNYTPSGGAMFFTKENGKRIDYIRDMIEYWYDENLLSVYEYYYLVSCLIESLPFISNTTGTYSAYLKHWDKRALNKLTLKPLSIEKNNRSNKSFNFDANKLVRNIYADITYIDPPYNNRQYASNYHVLENIARNNKPELKGKSKLFDWSNLKSDYSVKRKAFEIMTDLISNVQSKHIVLSYSNDGIITEKELIDLLKKNSINGVVKSKKIQYRKYTSKVKSNVPNVYEILFYIRKK